MCVFILLMLLLLICFSFYLSSAAAAISWFVVCVSFLFRWYFCLHFGWWRRLRPHSANVLFCFVLTQTRSLSLPNDGARHQLTHTTPAVDAVAAASTRITLRSKLLSFFYLFISVKFFS